MRSNRSRPRYGYGLQRIEAATAAAPRSAPSAASIHVISVGCRCVATSFGSSAKTSRELVRVLGGVVRPTGLLGDRHQGRCVREAGASEPSEARAPTAEPAAEDPAPELLACARELRGLGGPEPDRVDAHPPLDRVGHRVERLDPAGVSAVGEEHDDVRHVVVGATRLAAGPGRGRVVERVHVADRLDGRVHLGDRVEPLEDRPTDRGARDRS